MDKEIVLAIVAILGTCVGGLIWVIKFMFEKIIPVLEQLVKSTDRNTEVTKVADQYLRARNGRDAEVHKEIMKEMKAVPVAMQKIADSSVAQVIQAQKTVGTQRIEKQIVQSVETQ